jgi:hypothetical protein
LPLEDLRDPLDLGAVEAGHESLEILWQKLFDFWRRDLAGGKDELADVA